MLEIWVFSHASEIRLIYSNKTVKIDFQKFTVKARYVTVTPDSSTDF